MNTEHHDNQPSTDTTEQKTVKAMEIAHVLKQHRTILHYLRNRTTDVAPDFTVERINEVISTIDVGIMSATLDLKRLEKNPVAMSEKLADEPKASLARLSKALGAVAQLYSDRYTNRMIKLSIEASKFLTAYNDEQTAIALIDQFLV